MQANQSSGSNHVGRQSFSSGSGDHAMRPGASGQTTSHGSTFAASDGSRRSAAPDGGPGDPHGSGSTTPPHATNADAPARNTRPAPIGGSDDGSGHRGGGVRDVSGGDSGSGLKRGRGDSGDGADGNSDVSRHGKRARITPMPHRKWRIRTVIRIPTWMSTARATTIPRRVRRATPIPTLLAMTTAWPWITTTATIPRPVHRDTHPHAASVDDVEMADGTVHDQVDDLARRLDHLQVDKETRFNSKFADLVSTAKGGDPTTEDGAPGKNPYDDYLHNRVEENRPISFVVNAVVGADPVPDLKSFVDAVTNNAKDLHGRVAFVIGVNARNTPEGQASVDRALAQMKGVLDTIDHPVAFSVSPGRCRPRRTSHSGRCATTPCTVSEPPRHRRAVGEGHPPVHRGAGLRHRFAHGALG